ELWVYLGPERPGVGITNKNTVMITLLRDLAQLVDERHELRLGDCRRLGQTLRSTDQQEDEPVRKAVRAVGLCQRSDQFLVGGVRDEGGLNPGRPGRGVLYERTPLPRLPGLAKHGRQAIRLALHSSPHGRQLRLEHEQPLVGLALVDDDSLIVDDAPVLLDRLLLLASIANVVNKPLTTTQPALNACLCPFVVDLLE